LDLLEALHHLHDGDDRKCEDAVLLAIGTGIADYGGVYCPEDFGIGVGVEERLNHPENKKNPAPNKGAGYSQGERRLLVYQEKASISAARFRCCELPDARIHVLRIIALAIKASLAL
jgi:hypothetical protein